MDLSCYWKQRDAGGVVLLACQVAVSSVNPVQNRLKQFCTRSRLFKVCGKGFVFLRSHREHSYSASGFYAEGCSLVEPARVKLVQLHLVIVMALPQREKERGFDVSCLCEGVEESLGFCISKANC